MEALTQDWLVPSAKAICDEAMKLITTGGSFAAFRILGPQLSSLRDAAVAAGREHELIGSVREHPLFRICQEDPYTARAFTKPRGYAGDAVMMDYVYSGEPPAGTSPVGRQIFLATTRVPMGQSVLYRRALIHSYINDEIARHNCCRILSVASGHCREVESSLLFSDECDCEFVALDQDPEVGSRIATDYVNPRIRVVTERIKTLLCRRHELGEFDFIYSAGLYDYLPDVIATKLTSQLFSMLRPGGRLLIANFLHSSFGRGYLDAFMDWRLIYRSVDELLALFPEQVRPHVQVTTDPHENVAYAVVWRPGS